MIASSKRISNYHFRNFSLLIATDKYLKTHKKDTSKKRLHYNLLIVQHLIIPFLIQKTLFSFEIINSLSFYNFLKILSFYSAFYLFKYLLESLFFLKSHLTISRYIFQKKTYLNYISLVCFPLIVLATYQSFINTTFTWIALTSIVTIFTILCTIFSILNFRKFFFSRPYIFILYLCTYEIAPYLLSFYLINKNYLIITKNL